MADQSVYCWACEGGTKRYARCKACNGSGGQKVDVGMDVDDILDCEACGGDGGGLECPNCNPEAFYE